MKNKLVIHQHKSLSRAEKTKELAPWAHSHSDLAPTFELDEILREYARAVLRASIERTADHPLAIARDKIIALVQRELNK